MHILAFDTAGRGCSVGVWSDGQMIARAEAPMTHGQAESLIPQIGAVLDATGLAWGDLDRLAVTVGPGSFTGLRVGLAAAQGLALATDLPVVGVTTLEVFAHHAVAISGPVAEAMTGPETGPETGAGQRRLVVALVDARRDDLYCQPFAVSSDGTLDALEPPGSLPLTSIAKGLARWMAMVGAEAPPLLCGDGLDLVVEGGVVAGLGPVEALPSASPDVETLARLAAGRNPQDAPPRPLYIRPPDAAIPQNGGQIRPVLPHPSVAEEDHP